MATARKSSSSRSSSLPAKTNQRRNTKSGRDRMSSSSFALPKGTGSDPSRDQYRIDDAAHARNALARVAQHGTPSDQRTVRSKVKKKFPSINADSSSGSKRKRSS